MHVLIGITRYFLLVTLLYIFMWAHLYRYDGLICVMQCKYLFLPCKLYLYCF